MMEDGVNLHLPNSSNNGEMSIGNNRQQDEKSLHPQYSMPGILHFLQTEWARFETERSQWDVERAELQARIAFLQGERKGQENLKQDLVRRIKMLEFALKQERAKSHKLKYGTDPVQAQPDAKLEDEESMETVSVNAANSNAQWRQGRQLLRQYLQEIGYTDTIIDVRSGRVRQLLGLGAHNGNADSGQMVNGTECGNKRPAEGQGRRPNKKNASIKEQALMDSEASVMATFDFLGDDEDEDNLSDGENEEDEEILEKRHAKAKGNESMAGMDEVIDHEEALAEFDFLVAESGEGAGEARSQGDDAEWDKKDLSPSEEWGVDQRLISKLKEQYKKERKGKNQRPKRSTLQAMLANLGPNEDELPALQSGNASPPRNQTEQDSYDVDDEGNNNEGVPNKPALGVPGGPEDDALEAALGLGDLAGLTVMDETDPLSYDITSKEDYRKTWNAKYTLRSHFDGVRSLAFHPVEPVLVTASEDHTLKLWNLQKTLPAKKSASLDVEPVYTFRGHTAPVLCLAMSATGETCYSGSLDSTIRCWNIPSSNIDPYDSFDPAVLCDSLVAHTAAVWALSIHPSKMQLLSASGDGTVRLWNPSTKSPLLNTFRVEDEEGVPTSVDFIRCEPSQMVASYTSGNAYIYDLETAQQVISLQTNPVAEPAINNQINSIVSHPTLPLTITAHEDRQIRFFDNLTGKMVHSMVAHLDAVTSLAVDPNGLYLLSGSHDCSIRLWNVESKTCVQEITSHRKKFDESIHAVAFHPSKPYIASAGADALAKVFV